MIFGEFMRLLTLCLLLLASPVLIAQQYDLVIEGGRVLDPETGLDAVRNVGINGGKIARISSDVLQGKRVISAKNLVIAPGFIDLHQHGQDLASERVKAFDGVTTALELEIGVPDVAQFLKSKEGHSLINYGTSASHVAARALVFGAPIGSGPSKTHAGIPEILPKSGSATDEHATPEQIEVIGAAAITGASLHIVHINSSCLRDAPECLSMVAGARARGLDVTTEAYPYTAGMTALNSALFNPGWREKLGISYGELVIPDTGEHLTKERFDELHNSSTTHSVLIYANTQEVVDQVIPHPLVMIASDGAEGHPRNAGTYSRILAQYVRQKHILTLMDAVRKMTLMPAQVLER